MNILAPARRGVRSSAKYPVEYAGAKLSLLFDRDRYQLGSVVTDNFANIPGASVAGGAGFLTNETIEGAITGPYGANTLGETDLGAPAWEARTNLAPRSQELGLAPWAYGGAIVANATTAPDGTETADRLIAGTTTFSGVASLSIAATIGEVRTLSAYVKKDNWRYVGLRLNTTTLGGMEKVPFYDFDTDTLSNQGIAGATFSRQLLANGWVRLSLTYTATTTSGATQVWVTNSTGETNTPKSGGEAVYVWGAQLELGSAPSPYIPTTSAAATRTAIAPVITGISSTLLAPYTVLCEFIPFALTANHRVFSLNAGGTSTANSAELVLNFGASNRIDFQVKSGNTQIAYIYTGMLARAGAVSKAAVRVQASSVSLCVNGNTVVSQGSITPPTLSQLDLGKSADTSGRLNGWIRRIVILGDTTDAELQSLTAYNSLLDVDYTQ